MLGSFLLQIGAAGYRFETKHLTETEMVAAACGCFGCAACLVVFSSCTFLKACSAKGARHVYFTFSGTCLTAVFKKSLKHVLPISFHLLQFVASEVVVQKMCSCGDALFCHCLHC